MTSLISKIKIIAISLILMTFPFVSSAQDGQMQALIGQSLSKLQQPTSETFLTCIAELKRIEAMYPENIEPKYQLVLQSLNFSVINPHAEQTEGLLAHAEQTISKMEQMKKSDTSDICALKGFLYMVRIVQNPTINGQRYYIDVMQNLEKSLKINPENTLAKQLLQKFYDGMKSFQNTDK
ncbi:MAG: hypothetical protein Q4C26_08405 [Bacteroidales bacterium]|nr:hypothetical protein [Bacteroidales bacterium]